MVSAATSLEGNKLRGRAGSGDQDPEELGKSAPNPQDSSAKALVVGTLLEVFVTEQEGGLEERAFGPKTRAGGPGPLGQGKQPRCLRRQRETCRMLGVGRGGEMERVDEKGAGLLCRGVGAGDQAGGRRWKEWRDPREFQRRKEGQPWA